MNEKDDIILEYLESVGVAEPPKVILWNIKDGELADFSLRTTRRRLAKLESVGFVEIANEEGRYYRLTDEGESYLAGELDASGLEPTN